MHYTSAVGHRGIIGQSSAGLDPHWSIVTQSGSHWSIIPQFRTPGGDAADYFLWYWYLTGGHLTISIIMYVIMPPSHPATETPTRCQTLHQYGLIHNNRNI